LHLSFASRSHQRLTQRATVPHAAVLYTLNDEVLYGDCPAWSTSQAVEKDGQQFGDSVGVGAGKCPLVAFDRYESETGNVEILHRPTATKNTDNVQTFNRTQHRLTQSATKP